MADMSGILQVARSIAGEKKSKENQKVWDYLYQLTEELRYVLLHLDEDNMTSQAAETLAQMRRSISNQLTVEDVKQASDRATQQITGNRGGFVVLHDSDEDGQPDEILVMDSENMADARNIWRWNQSGLGHSVNGYGGPYTTAITQDGKIVADFVTTGTLNAQLVKVINLVAETVQSRNGNFTLEIQAARLRLLEGSNERLILRSNVENGGYMELTKALPDGDTQYTLAFADTLVVGGHESDSEKITGRIDTGSLYADSVRADSVQTDAISAGDVVAGIYATSLKQAYWQTLTINGVQYRVLLST